MARRSTEVLKRIKIDQGNICEVYSDCVEALKAGCVRLMDRSGDRTESARKILSSAVDPYNRSTLIDPIRRARQLNVENIEATRSFNGVSRSVVAEWFRELLLDHGNDDQVIEALTA